MAELPRHFVVVDDETAERIREMAEDLNVSESRLVRIAVEFYELCLDKVAEAVAEGESTGDLAVGLKAELADECRDVR